MTLGPGACSLSTCDRIQIIKMKILPKLLYLFLALPVPVPENQLREWNKHISRFIWLNKRPRVKFSILQLPRERGGLALPSLTDYYISAQLRYLVCWCNPCHSTKWKNIEMALSEIPIQSRLGHAAQERDIWSTGSQWLNLGLKVWKQLVGRLQIQQKIELLRWPAYVPDFVPHKTLDSNTGHYMVLPLYVQSLKILNL